MAREVQLRTHAFKETKIRRGGHRTQSRLQIRQWFTQNKKIITKKGKTTWQQYTFTYKYRTCVTQSFRASYNIDAGPLKRKEREQKTPTPCPQSTATLSHTDKYTTLHVYDQVEYAS